MVHTGKYEKLRRVVDSHTRKAYSGKREKFGTCHKASEWKIPEFGNCPDESAGKERVPSVIKEPPNELVFDYKEFPYPDDPKRPVADVTFINGERIKPLICIINSGADCCTIPISIGRLDLGINFEKLRLRPHSVGCACGRKPLMKGYYYQIEVDIRGHKFPVMVNWVESDTVPLIGRDGVFNKFDVTFEGEDVVRFRRRE